MRRNENCHPRNKANYWKLKKIKENIKQPFKQIWCFCYPKSLVNSKKPHLDTKLGLRYLMPPIMAFLKCGKESSLLAFVLTFMKKSNRRRGVISPFILRLNILTSIKNVIQ